MAAQLPKLSTSKIAPFTVSFPNTEEFHVLKSEIFTQDVYYFESDVAAPVIIDAGAHIGLTTLYFKKLFPAAQITAIEPNPLITPILQLNLDQNGLTDVTIAPVALADEAGQKRFFMDRSQDKWWSTGSFEDGAWNHQQLSDMIEVSALPLADFLTGPVDFLKLDIEGAEFAVLAAAREKLPLIKHMIIEFHPTFQQSLGKLVELLEQTGFRTRLWQDGQEIPSVKRARGLLYVEAVRRK